MKKYCSIIITILLLAFTLCACGATDENNEISIIDSGWSYDDGYVYYSVKLKNNSESKTYEYPTFRVTGYDKNGDVLGTEEQTLNEIKAGETTGYGFLSFESSEKPEKVDVEFIEETDNWIADEAGEHPGLIQMTAKDTKYKTDDIGSVSVTGKIVNENEESVESVAVSVLFKDDEGKLIGGDTTFVDGVKAKGETPFEINCSGSFATKNYEVFIQPW